MDVKFKFDLGDILKDVVTGFTGVVMARAEYYTGCIHYALQSRKLDDKGKTLSWEWMDETILKKLKSKVIFVKTTKIEAKSGGPMPCGPQM